MVLQRVHRSGSRYHIHSGGKKNIRERQGNHSRIWRSYNYKSCRLDCFYYIQFELRQKKFTNLGW